MFERLLLGHLVGDYLFQNEWMALTKSKPTLEGWIAAFIHSCLYTLGVCLLMWNFHWLWIVVVFLTHFPIDKFMLAERYRKIIRGTTLKGFISKNAGESFRHDMIGGGFASFTYAVTDNTMHLLLMYFAYLIIYK